MNLRSNPLLWSFSLGTWFGTRVRISWFLPLLAIPLLMWLDLAMGSAFFAILFVSILIHEFAHVIAARAVGSSADEILIWPLGGLAWIGPPSSPGRQAIIAAAGPVSNAVICLAMLHTVLNSGHISTYFNPLEVPLPKEEFTRHLATNIALLTFWFNWMLILVNLIPAAPMDGGQIARAMFVSRLGGSMGTEASIKLALVSAAIVAFVALIANHTLLLSLAFFAIIVAMMESFQMQMNESTDDSFMGYDFSQGYTSLERAETKSDAPARKSFLMRWKEKRKEARDKREAELHANAARVLDELLEKVHLKGLDSLTDTERRMLHEASERLRKTKTDN